MTFPPVQNLLNYHKCLLSLRPQNLGSWDQSLALPGSFDKVSGATG